MTKTILQIGILLGSLMISAPAQDAKSAQELLKTRFGNLPEEQRKAYAEHTREASRLFSLKRIFETLDEIYLCEKILKDDPNIVNLKGACYVEFRDFKKAKETFLHAKSLTADNVNVKFNLAELEFVQHQWEACHESLKEIEKAVPNSPKGMHRLVLFKSLLCKIKMAEAEGAADERKKELESEIDELSKRFDFRDDSPFLYYSKASLAFRNDDAVEADTWIGRARRIFPAITLSAWQDTLIEFGYIKSFYGGDSPE